MHKKPVKNSLRLLMFGVVALSFILCPSSFIEAAQWNPESVLTSFLKSHYPWEEIEVTNLRIVNKVPAEAPENIVVEKGPLGKAIFSFMFENGIRLIVKAKVKAFETVVKSKRSYRKGHVISPEDIYVSKMDIRRMPKSSINKPEQIIGKSLRKSMSVNVPIVENMIEHSRMVKRGKRVMLVINQMGLNIKTAGYIKEKGYVGSPVRAMNMSSRKEVVGVLIDENTVEVEL